MKSAYVILKILIFWKFLKAYVVIENVEKSEYQR